MKVMTVLGSPRRHGNTAQVLNWIEEQLAADGHRVDRANMLEYDIGHCRESHQCRYPEVNACGVADDAAALFERMLDADLTLFASPVFCWGFPAPLKALLDRLYCLAGFHDGQDRAIRLDGKLLGLVMTCGGPEEPNRDILARVFANLVEFWGARNAGFWLIPEADRPDTFNTHAQATACEFAMTLVSH